MPTRTPLADDHLVVRSGLRTLIDEHPDLVVVAEGRDGNRHPAAAATPVPGQAGTGVLILDTKMSNFDALAAPRPLAATYPDLHILILTGLDDEEHVHGLLKAGAWGYPLKEEAVMSLTAAVRSVARGDPRLISRYRTT